MNHKPFEKTVKTRHAIFLVGGKIGFDEAESSNNSIEVRKFD